jgi:hypothetical protein
MDSNVWYRGLPRGERPPVRFMTLSLEGSGFELPVPREKHGPTAPAIITFARRLEGLGGEFGTGQLSGRTGRQATWIQRQLAVCYPV